MEYADYICGDELSNINHQFLRHVGYSDFNNNTSYYKNDDKFYQHFFSKENIEKIQNEISKNLKDTKGNPIIVSINVITGVMSNIYENFTPETGDIYNRYNIPNKNTVNYISQMNSQVITVIINYINNENEIINNNKKLTVWTTVLGEFNKEGLRSHSKIKLREKRPMSMQFNMKY